MLTGVRGKINTFITQRNRNHIASHRIASDNRMQRQSATAAAESTTATTAATTSKKLACCDFSGKWVLDHAQTRGSVDDCMSMLGRSGWEIAMLKRASEVQLLQHYVMQQVHAVQQHVNYCVLGLANFEWEQRFALHNKLTSHAADEKRFGDYTTQCQLTADDAFRVIWCMTINDRKTVMTVTRTMPTDNANSCSVHMRIEQAERGVAECWKFYKRESRTPAEKDMMSKMRQGHEQHCYKASSSS